MLIQKYNFKIFKNFKNINKLEPTRCFQQRGIRKITAERNIITGKKEKIIIILVVLIPYYFFYLFFY